MNQVMKQLYEETIAVLYKGEEPPSDLLARVETLSSKEKQEVAKAIHDYSATIPKEVRERMLAEHDLHVAFDKAGDVPEMQMFLAVIDAIEEILKTELGEDNADQVSKLVHSASEVMYMLGWRLGRNRNWVTELSSQE